MHLSISKEVNINCKFAADKQGILLHAAEIKFRVLTRFAFAFDVSFALTREGSGKRMKQKNEYKT